MSGPWIPPVIASATFSGLTGSALRRITPEMRASVTTMVTEHCEGRTAVLTDGATSALAHALQLVSRRHKCVAMPGFGCVDLVAAARFAGVAIVTYDLDPATLAPDLDSVRRAVACGVDAIVIAPLFGFPLDVDALRSITIPAGIPIIEDAAQGAGGSWRGRRIGSFGDLAILSFGRGKGMSAGRGGALVARIAEYEAPVRDLGERLTRADAGWRDLIVSAAVWALARPGLYVVPASIPALRLGEMVFHDANAPRAMGDRAVALVPSALGVARTVALARGSVAERLTVALSPVSGLSISAPVADGTSGWLRLPLLDLAGRGAAPPLGILRSYPCPIRAMPEARAIIRNPDTSEPGADVLARTLLTLPTHRFVSDAVVQRIVRWAAT